MMLFTYAPINLKLQQKPIITGKIADKHIDNLKLAPGEMQGGSIQFFRANTSQV